MGNLKDGLDDITEDLGQSFEEIQNTIELKARIQLLRYMQDSNWLDKQLGSTNKFKLSLLKIAKEELATINRKYDKAFSKGLKNANEKPNEEALKRLNEIKTSNAIMIAKLTDQVAKAHQQFVLKVGFKANEQIEIGKLEKTNFLYNQICKVLGSKEAQDEVKIVYRNGKQMNFKSYMEMNARTTLNQEIGQQQMESAVNNGDVFWLCNSFEDCRPSHADYQGKVYYDERYMEMGFDDATLKQIEQVIADRDMLSRQQVENNDPWLGNCPNCRHEFVSVPIEDVISRTDKQLLKDNNMNVSKASEEKYQNTQLQRSYERKIRDYKFQVQQDKILKDNAPNGTDTSEVDKRLAHNTMMLNRYRDNIKELIANNDYLERDYKRENVRILREDLGAKANGYK